MPWPGLAALRPIRPPSWMPRSWATGSDSAGHPRHRTVWDRSPTSSSASGAARSSTPPTAPGSPRSARCEFDDTHATPGDTVGYAVLSKRGGAESISAISLGPFVFLADVKDVRVDFRQDVVELAWQPPRGVSEIRVIRKQGAPPTRPPRRRSDRDGASIMHWTETSIRTRSITMAFMPSTRCPTAGCSLRPGSWCRRGRSRRCRRSRLPGCWSSPGRGVRLDWIEPVRGAVKILRTADPLPVPAGTRLPASRGRGARRPPDRAGLTRSSLRPRASR